MEKATSLEAGGHRRPKRQKGFTLVELMVVVAIIGILASIGLPALFRYVRNAEATEAVNMSGAIARNLLGYQQARGLDDAEAATALTGRILSSVVANSTLDLIIPELQLPTGHPFAYTVSAGVVSSELVFCIIAVPEPSTATTANHTILYSSTLSTDAAWNNHYTNNAYVTEATGANANNAGGSCTNAGAFQ